MKNKKVIIIATILVCILLAGLFYFNSVKRKSSDPEVKKTWDNRIEEYKKAHPDSIK